MPHGANTMEIVHARSSPHARQLHSCTSTKAIYSKDIFLNMYQPSSNKAAQKSVSHLTDPLAHQPAHRPCQPNCSQQRHTFKAETRRSWSAAIFKGTLPDLSHRIGNGCAWQGAATSEATSTNLGQCRGCSCLSMRCNFGRRQTRS